MEFAILGSTALYVDGKPVPIGAAKQRAMLGLLLYHAGAPVRIDTLVDQLWDGRRKPESCRADLYAMASRIRAVLHRVGLDEPLVSIRSPRGYQLNINSDLIDFHRFEQAVNEAREAANHQRHDIAATILTKAIGLWRGEPLADLQGAQAEHLRRHLNDALLAAHRLLADSHLKIGRHQAVLAQLEPFVRADNIDIDEILAQHWITALCAAGREGDARHFFMTFRRRYRAEMRAEPAVTLPPAMGRAQRSRSDQGVPPETAAGRAILGCQLLNDIHDFTGHGDLLAELDTLTGTIGVGTNVVLISGMPGVGKTTLAVHWAHQRSHRFPDGQLYLNINAFGTGPSMQPDEALGRFLNALGFPADRTPLSAEERRDRLNELLVGKRILIILDNVRDSRQARALIPAASSCVILVTSRNRLSGLTIREGVRSLTVPPLPNHDCLALLDRVVGAARATQEPSAMRTLAQLSGGLPLALRIIGERVAERPRARITDLVDELGARLLDSETVDDEAANLRTIFAWSYDALGPDVAHLFRLLGFYPGSNICPEAAAAMHGGAAHDTEHLLNTLASFYLINHDTSRRYRFHDLLQLYAAERASQEVVYEEQACALHRLLDWYLLSAVNAATLLAPDCPPVPDLPAADGVRPQTFATDLEAMRWCEAERANIGAVTRWAESHGFHRHGWQIPGTVYEIYDRYGRQEDMLMITKVALSSAQRDSHPVGQIGTLNNLGATYFAIRDYGRAIEAWEKALELAREIGYKEAAVIACSHNLASAHLRTGNTAEAVRLYIEVLDACRKASYPLGEAATLNWLGYAYRQMRQYGQAVTHYFGALAIREQIGSLRGQGTTHGELAALYLEMGQAELALQHCRLAAQISDRTKDEGTRCDVLTTRADVERELAMYKEAARDAQRAITISEEIADPQRRSRALTVLADILLALGNRDAASRLCQEAMDLVSEDPDPDARSLQRRLVNIANK